MDPIIPTCKALIRALVGSAALLAVLTSGAAQAARRREPDAIGRYARARMADAIGLPDEALAAYNDALTASPDSSAVALHQGLARQAGVPELVRTTPGLYVHRSPTGIDLVNGLAWRLRRERGAEIEVLEGAALRDAEPSPSAQMTTE